MGGNGMDTYFPAQLQRQVEQAIVDGKLMSGLAIYADALASAFHTTPNTMFRVLNAAHRKGLVKKQADGHFVVVGLGQPSIESVFQHTEKSGLKPTSVVRAVNLVPADSIVAEKLRMSPDDLVYRQIRTRQVNNKAIANQCNYIPLEICPGLEAVDLSHTSFQVTLEKRFLTIIAHIEETFALAPATPEDAKILGLAPNAQVLRVQRMSFSSNREPLVWADIHVRADQYAAVSQLWPQAAALINPAK